MDIGPAVYEHSYFSEYRAPKQISVKIDLIWGNRSKVSAGIMGEMNLDSFSSFRALGPLDLWVLGNHILSKDEM